MRSISLRMAIVASAAAVVGGATVWGYYQCSVIPPLVRLASRPPAPPRAPTKPKPAPSQPLTPTARELADWPTYTHYTQPSFRIKFPPGWWITDQPNQGVAVIANFEYPAEDGGELEWPETKRMISVEDNPKRLTPEAFYYESRKGYGGDETETVVSKRAMMLGGANAVKLKIEEQEWGPYFLILIPRRDKMIEIVSLENDEHLDDMLSTFRFVH